MMRPAFFYSILFIFCACKQHTGQQHVIQTPFFPQDSTIIDSGRGEYFKYLQNIYNPETETNNPSYNYSNKWDFDGDGKNDSVYFIGNGGAHIYFYLKLILSADSSVKEFPSCKVDMPFIENEESLHKYGKHSAIQFAVDDFDNDGISDIYLNFDNHWGHIPKKWKEEGVRTKNVVMRFPGNTLTIRDY